VVTLRGFALYLCTHAIAGSSLANLGVSNTVDVYNSATGVWSTAQLSVARSDLAAASVGNLAIFAGGYRTCAFHL
jgi:hypothetical protein